MLFAIVPAAPPTRKNQRTTSCPAPISANVPYQRGSRLIFSAFECVSIVSSFTSQTWPVFRALNVQIVHQSPQSKASSVLPEPRLTQPPLHYSFEFYGGGSRTNERRPRPTVSKLSLLP